MIYEQAESYLPVQLNHNSCWKWWWTIPYAFLLYLTCYLYYPDNPYAVFSIFSLLFDPKTRPWPSVRGPKSMHCMHRVYIVQYFLYFINFLSLDSLFNYEQRYGWVVFLHPYDCVKLLNSNSNNKKNLCHLLFFQLMFLPLQTDKNKQSPPAFYTNNFCYSFCVPFMFIFVYLNFMILWTKIYCV